MAGTLSVQKIQGLATSATPTVVEVSSGHALHTNTLKGTTTAGSINVQGEGSNTTNLQQGLCKHWSQTDNFDTIDDSFNLSTLTDVGTGQSRLTLTTNMASENNACINDQNYFGANGVGGAEFDNSVTQTTGGTHTTSTVALSSKYTSSNLYSDTNGTGCIFSTVFGDLA